MGVMSLLIKELLYLSDEIAENRIEEELKYFRENYNYTHRLTDLSAEYHPQLDDFILLYYQILKAVVMSPYVSDPEIEEIPEREIYENIYSILTYGITKDPNQPADMTILCLILRDMSTKAYELYMNNLHLINNDAIYYAIDFYYDMEKRTIELRDLEEQKEYFICFMKQMKDIKTHVVKISEEDDDSFVFDMEEDEWMIEEDNVPMKLPTKKSLQIEKIREYVISNTLEDLINNVKETVFGQDEAVRLICIDIYFFLKQIAAFGEVRIKRNTLIAGPSGVGKTETFKALSKLLPIPVFIKDSTIITTNGFKGEDLSFIYNILSKDDLYKIIFMDEFDKLLTPVHGEGGSNHSYAIQSELLTFLDGTVITFQNDEKNETSLDSNKILFFGGGAFQGLFFDNKKSVGFTEASNIKNVEDIKEKDIMDMGLRVEMAGRFERIVIYRKLDKSILSDIVKKFALVYENTLGIEINIDTDSAYEALTMSEMGAREVKKIVSNALVDLMMSEMDSKDVVELYFKDAKGHVRINNVDKDVRELEL